MSPPNRKSFFSLISELDSHTISLLNGWTFNVYLVLPSRQIHFPNIAFAPLIGCGYNV